MLHWNFHYVDLEHNLRNHNLKTTKLDQFETREIATKPTWMWNWIEASTNVAEGSTYNRQDSLEI